MKVNAFLFIVFFALLSTFTTVQAQKDSAGTYYIYGVGSDSCATFIKSEERRDAAFYREIQWVLGYISSMSVEWSRKNKVHPRKLDIEGKIAALKDYCVDNKTVSLAASAEALWIQMMIRTPELFGE